MLTLRLLTSHDVTLICGHRKALFHEAGFSADTISAMLEPFQGWVATRLEDGRYSGFVAEDSGRPVGSVGLMIIDWPPHPRHPTESHRGYILNLYVELDARRRGVASVLMAGAEGALLERGVHYTVLHATPAGRPLYERNGWHPTVEMAKSFAL